MLVAIRTNVAKLKQQGRSLDSSRPSQPSRPRRLNSTWGQFLITPAFFTKLVYEGVELSLVRSVANYDPALVGVELLTSGSEGVDISLRDATRPPSRACGSISGDCG